MEHDINDACIANVLYDDDHKTKFLQALYKVIL